MPVRFCPQSPGVHVSAVYVLSSQGVRLGTVYLSGIGLGAVLDGWPGTVTDFAGSGNLGSSGDGALATAASFLNPQGLAIDESGAVYIADSVASTIRRVDPATSIIITVAGNGSPAFSGDGGPALSASLNTPTAVTVNGAGDLYIADSQNNRVRRVDAISGIVTTVAGGGNCAASLGDGGLATAACLSNPNDVAVDGAGNLWIADTYNNRVRKVDLSGIISTVAGGGSGAVGVDALGDGAPATNAILLRPSSVAISAAGDLFISDAGHNLVRLVRSGIVSVLAGNGAPGYNGDGGLAKLASISAPLAIRVDGSGTLFIADTGNAVVRAVDPSGVIQTLAGAGGQFGFGGNGGSASAALFNALQGIAVDSSGGVLVSDPGNLQVRRIGPVPATVTLPSAGVGRVGAPANVYIRNAGNVSTALTNLSLPNGFVQQSSGGLDCTTGTALAAGSSCVLTIAALPSQAGLLSGVALVNSQSQGVSLAVLGVALSTTTSGAAQAFSSLSSNGVLFPAQRVGLSSSAQILTLHNASASSSIQLIGAAFSGSNVNDFQVATGACSTVNPGGTCSLQLVFSPSAQGARSASLVLAETDGTVTYTQSVFLSGTGVDIAPTISPAILDFGTQPLHVSSARKAITFTNAGASTLNVSSVSFAAGPDFSVTDTNCSGTLLAGASCNIGITFNPSSGGPQNGVISFADSDPTSPQSAQITGSGGMPLGFVPITPCRVVDTRYSGGPIPTNSSRTFSIQGNCGVPFAASAYSINVTAVPHGSLGHMTIWATGQPQPFVSVLNSNDGEVKANATIVPAGANGSVDVYATDPTDVILDVNGYFVSANAASALEFYPLPPCRILDTRNAPGVFGGPGLLAGQQRNVPVVSSGCNVPALASAYSLNFTVFPAGFLGYLATWPTGIAQPAVSTLNDYSGTLIANAAIVPTGTSGDISMYATNDTGLVLDINGYFAPPSQAGLAFYTVTPCRVFDSRTLGGVYSVSGIERTSFTNSQCGIPSSAKAYVVNATVVPIGFFGYLTLWPDGQNQPLVSTVNSINGEIAATMAIVPASNGAIDSFLLNPANLILDVFGYFAP